VELRLQPGFMAHFRLKNAVFKLFQGEHRLKPLVTS